jgi:molecular chaperone GrpE
MEEMNSGNARNEAEDASLEGDAVSQEGESSSEGVDVIEQVEEVAVTADETGDPQQAEIEVAKQMAEEWRARAYRSAADLENTRKRFQREREELRKYGNEDLLKDLLPVIDNLERAMAHAADGDGLVEGVGMVLKQFTQVAETYGAKPLDALGQEFDPQVHEAMSQRPSNEVEPGIIVEVFQRGWMLHDRLVRPAMVIVAAPRIEEVASVDVDDEPQVAEAQDDEQPTE